MLVHTRYICIGVCVFVGTIVFFNFTVPTMMYYGISYQRVLKPGGVMRRIWERLPIPLQMSLYLFNVTNPDEVTKGAKPNLVQVGPYIYEEWHWKHNLQDRKSDDSVSYQPGNTWYFDQEKSGRLTGNEMITLPNVLLLGIVELVQKEMPGIIGLVDVGMNELLRNPTSIYMTVRVRDLLFDGILINCTGVQERSTKLICMMFNMRAGVEIKRIEKTLYSYSLLGWRNGTWGEPYRVRRGTKNFMEVGEMLEYKNVTVQDKWLGDKCNEIRGTDGTMIAPYLNRSSLLEAFVPEVCRTFQLRYHRDVIDPVMHVPAYQFTGDLGDVASNPAEHCFCNTAEVPKSCPLKGTMDLTRCAGLPIILSLPHFYKAEPRLLDGVTGMKPDPELHDIYVNLIPEFGAPVSASVNVQFNIQISNNSRLEIMKNLPTALHPVMWGEENVILPRIIVNAVYVTVVWGTRLIALVKWVLILGSLGLIGHGSLLWYRDRNVRTVTPDLMSDITSQKKPFAYEEMHEDMSDCRVIQTMSFDNDQEKGNTNDDVDAESTKMSDFGNQRLGSAYPQQRPEPDAESVGLSRSPVADGQGRLPQVDGMFEMSHVGNRAGSRDELLLSVGDLREGKNVPVINQIP